MRQRRLISIALVLALLCSSFTIQFQAAQASSGTSIIGMSIAQPSPTLNVHPTWDRIGAEDWPEGAMLTLTIDDPGTPQSPDYSDTRVAPADFDLWGQFNVQAGHIVTVSDGVTTKMHTVTALKGWWIDAATDTVTGAAEAGSEVVVNIHEMWEFSRRVTADAGGNWLADFSVAGPGEQMYDIQGDTSIFAEQRDGDDDRTNVLFGLPMIVADHYSDWVYGNDWDEDSIITLSIDDPATGPGWDYTDTRPVPPPGECFAGQQLCFDVGAAGIDLQPGQLIRMTDGSRTKEHVVANFWVTGWDLDADALSGTADPGTDISIAYIHPGSANRHEVVDQDGYWIADFAHPGDEPDEQETADVVAGSNFIIEQRDADNDETQPWWAMPNPSSTARMTENEVHGYSWLLHASVTLTIDDPTTPSSPDYTDTQTAIVASWNPDDTFVQFRLGQSLDLQPGQLITMTDGVITKTHTVTNLVVTGVDPVADTVAGTADPGAQIHIGHICDENGCAFRREFADANGNWIANFAVPGDDGDEQETFDIRPGMGSEAREPDGDNDFTQYGWYVPNPYIEVSPGSRWAHAREWPTGALITMTIDDPANGLGVDYTATAPMHQAPWNPGDPNDIVADFDLGTFVLQPGQIVTMTDGVTAKTLIIAQLEVTSVDSQTETVSGIGTPGIQAQVCANIPNRCITRWVTPDGSGNWTANYAVAGIPPNDLDTVDLQPGSNGWAAEYEADSDRTWADWRVPNPNLHVFVTQDRIEARDWPLGHVVTLTIDNPGTPESPDYTDSRTMGPAPWNPNEVAAEFDLNGVYHYQTGDLITVSDGVIIKMHTVVSILVTGIDPASDTISGIADPGAEVQIDIHRSGASYRRVTADGSGQWLADFSTPWADQGSYDLVAGLNGAAMRYDDDGDASRADWRVPNPNFSVRLFDAQVEGWEWPLGADVTMTIDDPATPQNPDYTDTQTVGLADWDPNQTYIRFDFRYVYFIQPGYVVTLGDGVTTKSHTVTDLAITDVDPDTDTVSGTADTGSRVDVWICNQQGCFNRHETAEGGEFVGVVDAGRVADQFIPSILWGYNETLADYAYDPVLAQSLLTDAGYPNGFAINLWVRDVPRIYLPDAVRTTEAIRNYLSAIGVTVNLEVLESGELLERVWNGEADLFLLGWVADYGHPDNFYYQHFCTEADALGLQSEDFCDSIMAARAETDPLALESLYEGISQQLHDAIPLVPLAHVRTPLLFRHDVTGFIPSWDWTGGGSFANISYGGSDFTYALSTGVPGLDPALYIDSSVFLVTDQVMEPLVKIDAESASPLSGLAESWSVSPDSLTWTFTIRSGVTFHDGTPLDAAAVLYNLERWWDPAHPYHDGNFEYFGTIFNGFKGDPDSLIVALGTTGNQVQITLWEPFNPLLSVLAMPTFAIASPAAIQSGTLDTHPVGTGPFTFVDWHSDGDGTVHLTANPGYWGGAPSLTNLTFQAIPDEAARFAALQANTVQGIEVQDWSYADIAEGDPNLRVVWRPEMNVAYLGINQGHSPLDNLLVRQAIAHAIDKQAIIDQTYNTVEYGTGTWTADFAHPGDEGDEQTTWDMQPGDGGDVAQSDDDGDRTQIWWSISNPRMEVSYEHDWIQISGFTPNGQVTYTIFDHQGGHELFGPVTGPVDSHGNGWISNNLFHTDLVPGMFIVAADETTGEVVTLTIREVELEYISADDDIAFGTAEPNTTIELHVSETHDSGFNLTVPVDGNGNWYVDLAAAGHPIDEYRYANADLHDAEGDTIIAQNPRVHAHVKSDNFSVDNFSKNADVTLSLYDAPGGNILYGPVTLHTDSNGNAWVNVWEFGIDLQVGHFITAYDHALDYTKSLVVEPFTFDEMNAADDTVRGTSAPGEWVDLHVESLFSNWGLNAITDALGQWFADYGFEGYDITEQMWANGWAVDNQGNWSEDHTTGLPGIEVSARDNWINGWNFTPNRTVRIEIYDFEGGTLLAEVVTAVGGNTQFHADYGQHQVDLQPGMYLFVEDTETGKTASLTLAYLTFDGVDYDADTTWGRANSGAQVVVRADWLFEHHEVAVVADEYGNWFADFAPLGADLMLEWGLRAMVFDLELDATVADAPRPPQFTAGLDGDWIRGNDWTPNATVEIRVYTDPGGPLLADPINWNTDSHGQFDIELRNYGIDLVAGDYVHIVDSASGLSKEQILASLTIGFVDVNQDVMGGTAAPDTRLTVNFDGFEFDLFSGSDGNWLADFGAHDFDVRPGMWGNARIFDSDGDSTQVDWHVPNPHLTVWPEWDNIEARDWPEGATITLTIDDPATADAPDYTNSGVVLAHAPWETSGETWAEFGLQGIFDVQPGFVVTLTDGATTKVHTVTNVAVTSVDAEANLVNGTADQGSAIEVQLWGAGSIRVTADASGNWSADWTGRFDIVPGANGAADQPDADGDVTRVDWRVPNPRFNAWPLYDVVAGWEWPAGTTVVLTIDDDGDPNNGTLYTTGTVADEWGDVKFEVWDALDLQPGHRVTLNDGATTKVHTVTALAVTLVDAELDTITGTAEPYAEFEVCIWGVPCHRVIADADGEWSTDFSGEYDLVPGANGAAQQCDEDGDCTQADWRVPNPRFMVDFTNNSVSGEEWPVGIPVTLTIDDPSNGFDVDFTDTKVVEADPWGKGVPGVIFAPTLMMKAGFVVTMTDGHTTKTHIVKDLVVTTVDAVTDTLSGTAEAGASIAVWVDQACDYAGRHVTADVNGQWVADFSVPGDEPGKSQICDLQLGMDGRANQSDEDGDSTEVPWPQPVIAVRLNELAIHGYEWPAGAAVTLTVDDPTTSQSPDYTDIQTVRPETPWGGPPPTVAFDYQGEIDVQAGFVVRLTDGTMTKEHVVTALAVTEVDLETDTVTGTAQPGSEVDVYICDEVNCYRRREIADPIGNWTASFAVPGDQEDEQTLFDIHNGTAGAVRQHDEDGDYTRVGWMAGSPVSPFVVLGQEGVLLEQGTTVVNGDVGANVASEGPYLSDNAEVTIGQNAWFLDPTSRVMGDSVYLKQGAQVYDVYYNELSGKGEVLGDHHTPLALPLVAAFPAVPDATPGTQNFDVPQKGALTLDAGAYGMLKVRQGATITFTGGVYDFAGWDVGQNVKLYFEAPTQIRIGDKLAVDQNSYIGPAPYTTGLEARDILIYVLGQNGNTGKLGANPKAATFGMKNTLIADVYAPNGTLWIRQNSDATGAFLGKWVVIGQKVTLTLDSGW